jgi:hypothetical protein
MADQPSGVDIATLYFYYEIKALIGDSRSKEWLKSEISARNHTPVNPRSKSDCGESVGHYLSEAQNSCSQFRQMGAHHESLSLSHSKSQSAEVSAGKNLPISDLSDGPKALMNRGFSRAESGGSKWLQFTDAAHLLETNSRRIA